MALWRVLDYTSGSAAPRRSSTRHMSRRNKAKLKSARERAVVAEPLGDPPLSPVRLYLSSDALHAVCSCISAFCRPSHTAQYPYCNGFDTEKYTFTYSRLKRKTVYNFKCRNGERANAQKNCKIFRLNPCFLPFSSLNSEGYFSSSQKSSARR